MINILLADDSPFNILVLEKYLEKIKSVSIFLLHYCKRLNSILFRLPMGKKLWTILNKITPSKIPEIFR